MSLRRGEARAPVSASKLSMMLQEHLRRFRALRGPAAVVAVFIFLSMATASRAADPGAESAAASTPEAESEEGGAGASSVESSASGAAEPAVEPLDMWVNLPPPPASSSSSAGVSSSASVPAAGPVEAPAVSASSSSAFPSYLIEEPVSITKQAKARLARVRQRERSRSLRQYEKRVESYRQDPRGKPELRVCSIDLNNFATLADVAHLVRGGNPAALLLKEHTTVNAVLRLGCGVVALQGVAGKNSAAGAEALKRLTKPLSKRSGEAWQAYIAESPQHSGFNAFLVRPSAGKVFGTVTHAAEPFVHLKGINSVRGIFQLDLRVPGQDGRRPKAVLLINFHFQNALKPTHPEPEMMRLQLAEGVRKVAVQALRDEMQFDPENVPLVIVLGERNEPISRPAHVVLSGRARLSAFDPGGGCVLHEEPEAGNAGKKDKAKLEKLKISFECSREALGPAVLFDLLTSGVVASGRPEQYQEDGETRWRRSAADRKAKAGKDRWDKVLSAGMYLFQEDLPIALRHPDRPMEYSTGIGSVRNGKPESPLIWADFNW